MSDLPDIPTQDSGQTPIGQPPGLAKKIVIPWRLILALVLVVFVGVFAFQNTESVDVEFLNWEFSLPLIVLIAGTIVIAVLVSDLIGWWWRRRKRRRQRV